MSRNARPKRRKVGTKRLDLTDIKHALRDGKMWTAIGTTYKPDDAADYWRIVPADDGSAFDLVVEVELHPGGDTVTARIPSGVWDVPDLGDEVIVAIPEGELEFQPSIVCRLSSGSMPTAQGPQPGRIAIVRGEVVVHDGAGGAVALALKSDLQSAVDTFNSHVHVLTITAASGAGGTGTAAAPATGMTDPTGTTVLKAK